MCKTVQCDFCFGRGTICALRHWPVRYVITIRCPKCFGTNRMIQCCSSVDLSDGSITSCLEETLQYDKFV